VNLVRNDGVDGFLSHMTTAWKHSTGQELKPLRCQMAEGAR
jgi:hypothetical protein